MCPGEKQETPASVSFNPYFLVSSPATLSVEEAGPIFGSKRERETHLPSTVTGSPQGLTGCRDPAFFPLSHTEVKSTLIHGSVYAVWSTACWGGGPWETGHPERPFAKLTRSSGAASRVDDGAEGALGAGPGRTDEGRAGKQRASSPFCP